MGVITKDDGWRVSDKLWKEVEALLPSRKAHPLGCQELSPGSAGGLPL